VSTALVNAACEARVGNVTVCSLRATERETLLLVTPPDDAVIDALPGDAPVTVFPLTVTAVPLTLNEGVMLNGFPYWSTPAAVRVAVPPTPNDTCEADKLMLCSTGGLETTATVTVAGGTAEADTVMVDEPAARA